MSCGATSTSGTGNYHALTARIYEDFGLFTADEEIAADVADLFNYVTGFGRPQRFRKLLVAPFNLRRRLVEEIRRVAKAATEGEHARIRLKTNALTDETIIEELYAASQAGAEIDIVARSICPLRPGVPGLCETIRVRSVARALPRAQPLLHLRGRRRHDDVHGQRRPHDPEPRPPHRDRRAGGGSEGAGSGRSAPSTCCSADNTAWTLQPNGSWKRQHPRKDQGAQGSARRAHAEGAGARTSARRPASSLGVPADPAPRMAFA